MCVVSFFFFFQAEDGIRDADVTGVQTCALPIWFAGRLPGRFTMLPFLRDDTWAAGGAGLGGRIGSGASGRTAAGVGALTSSGGSGHGATGGGRTVPSSRGRPAPTNGGVSARTG